MPAAGPRALAFSVYADGDDRSMSANDKGYEGIACVDDVARGEVLFLDLWQETSDPRLRAWADLMLRLQKEDGHWYVEGKSNEPYTLTGSGTLWSLIKAGEILDDPRCADAVKRYVKSMNDKQNVVLGTHAFLSVQYANVADAVLA